ncbi:Hypothetical predicted protein [Marmota monax]|uniref:WD repeat-containing protein 25 n=1 Tax=Marmota monax TaxID=9995 RepID=A0A5E4ANY6_MARMO|nr:WD repeat-containing protein 25 [Marmota monax]VTJ59137.1 Hypothetical predicted protein [Marmota monax]
MAEADVPSVKALRGSLFWKSAHLYTYLVAVSKRKPWHEFQGAGLRFGLGVTEPVFSAPSVENPASSKQCIQQLQGPAVRGTLPHTVQGRALALAPALAPALGHACLFSFPGVETATGLPLPFPWAVWRVMGSEASSSQNVLFCTQALRHFPKVFSVWNAVDSGRCLQTYSLHREAVRAARWSPCGGRILSGGFDFALHLTDLETGTQLFSGRSDFRITTLKFHPKDHSIFLCGGFSSEIKAWDIRTGKVVRGYKATIQQTLDILFLQEGSEFLSSTDASTRDSADRTIIAWDFRTSAKISNQIFHERYTCPSLALHPREPVFLAQTNGNYLALFSAVWPYRMSRRRRYEGHKVEGYAVGCECSPCGDLLVTGSADGRVLMFSFRTASRACTLQGHTQACVGTTYHPVLPSVLGTCSWGGDIKIWH